MQKQQRDSYEPWWLCIATGPSLARADCDALRWTAEHAISVNCGVFYAPWTAMHYAADDAWYKYYGWRTKPWYKGERYGCNVQRKGVTRWRGTIRWTERGGNSGHHAIHLAVEKGAKRIALIGYDHQHTGGKTHVHGDHPSVPGNRMGNAPAVHVWKKRMPATMRDCKERGVELVNLTRVTAITCIPRMTVEEFNKEYKPT